MKRSWRVMKNIFDPRCLTAGLATLLLLAGCNAEQAPSEEPPTALPAEASAKALTPAGYDTIRIGMKPANVKGYTLTGGENFEESCKMMAVEEVYSLHAMVENGVITRLTVSRPMDGPPSNVRTDRDISIDSTEKQVRAAYKPLREEPNHYIEAPAKYLIFEGGGTRPGLRFEISAQREVYEIHAGREPALGYVEGCSCRLRGQEALPDCSL